MAAAGSIEQLLESESPQLVSVYGDGSNFSSAQWKNQGQSSGAGLVASGQRDFYFCGIGDLLLDVGGGNFHWSGGANVPPIRALGSPFRSLHKERLTTLFQSSGSALFLKTAGWHGYFYAKISSFT